MTTASENTKRDHRQIDDDSLESRSIQSRQLGDLRHTDIDLSTPDSATREKVSDTR